MAHQTKLYRDKSSGTCPIPTPYDVSGSAHFRNKADNCLTIWRNESDDAAAVQVHIQKIRFREVGRGGMVELFYDNVSGNYSEHDPRSILRPSYAR